MQTQTVSAENSQLALFNMTSPALPSSIGTKVGKNKDTGAVTSISLSLETRKLVATRLKLTDNADNRDTITAEIIKMKDAVKMAGIGEIAKLAASPNWTGAAFRISTNKKGDKQKASFTLETVNRTGHKVSSEQLVKALASMSEEQRLEVLDKADAAGRALGKIVELKDAGDDVK
jgi:hypothetical protein